MISLEEVLSELVAHCEAAYPAEGGGLILEIGSGCVVLPMLNLAAAPAGSTPCFELDLPQLLEVHELLGRSGGRLVGVFHSHPDRPAYLSDDDRRHSTADGQPTLPGADQLVVSVQAGRARALAQYRWVHGLWSEVRVLDLARRTQAARTSALD